MSGQNGWEASAAAWMAEQGEAGDFAREFILDRVMLARLRLRPHRDALDVGCGEGRFARVMAAEGLRVTGLEPVAALRARAQALDPGGCYIDGRAEALPLPDARFDLVVSYLTLIDIDGLEEAVAEMARVLRPGGRLLIANLNPMVTAGHWHKDAEGRRLHFAVDRYLEARADWVEWAGIRVRNWHRPMQDYMAALLGQGLQLLHFEEPAPHGGDPARGERLRRIPWFHVMEWARP